MNKTKQLFKSPILWIIVAFIVGLLISTCFADWREMAPVDMRNLHDGSLIAYEANQVHTHTLSSFKESPRFYYQPPHQLSDSPRFYLHDDTNIDNGMLIQL